MAVRVSSATLVGIDAALVEVETQVVGSLRRFTIVGLPDGVVREAKYRVRCAIENSGLEFPRREIVVSLAPAGLPKVGARFDLAIAVSILAADQQIAPESLGKRLFLGELGLDGRLKPTSGELAAADLLRGMGDMTLVIPRENAALASCAQGVPVVGLESLLEALAYCRGVREPKMQPAPAKTAKECLPTFADVHGQEPAKRVMEIAAAGGHNALLVGPPGAGKSMLARRIRSILPALEARDAMEVSKVRAAYTAESAEAPRFERLPPFRAPHHTISAAGLIGGGSIPTPGEISLAHRGVLFLDELPELRRDALESLREPLETGRICISRARMRVRFPAEFTLIAAMNPCPCGHWLGGHSSGGVSSEVPRCECTPGAVSRYRSKISGPMIDRFDLRVWVAAVPVKALRDSPRSDPTRLMRERVQAARARQARRFSDASRTNASMTPGEIRRCCTANKEALDLLEHAAERLSLSARSYDKILKVSRTIADLQDSEELTADHVAEAVSFRN